MVPKEMEPETRECAWWDLVLMVGDDIWHAMTTFAAKPTLEDSFTADEAAAIFRFGHGPAPVAAARKASASNGDAQ